MNRRVYVIWFVLVCLWNFGVPKALPILDAFVAVVLSFISKYLEHKMEEK